MLRWQTRIGVALLALAISGPACAQEEYESAPTAAPDDQTRITPAEQSASDKGIMSTHPLDAGSETSESKKLPWLKTAPPMEGALVQPAPLPAPITPGRNPFGTYQPKSPFGHAEPTGPVIPSEPHNSTAVPVEDVDAIEASEPQPATPVPLAADPAKEDPAAPTELTSPIFDTQSNPAVPRKVVIRALNKVTAQSELIEIKPGDTVKFGRLEIMAITCRGSSPTSQTDYAGLLEISEHLVDKNELKPLFRGWMYASSPSIAALEHPVYDVTMVDCKQAVPPAKTEEKSAPAAPKKGKK